MDEDGFIFLGYEAVEAEDQSKFLWSKNYTDAIDAQRMKAETKNKRWVVSPLSGIHTFKMSSPIAEAVTEGRGRFQTFQDFGRTIGRVSSITL